MDSRNHLDHLSAEHVPVKINDRTGNAVLTFAEPIPAEATAQITEYLGTHISGALTVGVHEKYVVLIGGPWGRDTFFRHLQDVFSKEFWSIYLVTDQPKAA